MQLRDFVRMWVGTFLAFSASSSAFALDEVIIVIGQEQCGAIGQEWTDLPSGGRECVCSPGWTPIGTWENTTPMCGLQTDPNPPTPDPNPPGGGGGGGGGQPPPDPIQACLNAPSLPASDEVCNQYAPLDTYFGSNARCFCKRAGNSEWAQAVRGCLRCAYDKGVDKGEAHTQCYAWADYQYDQPSLSLAATYGVCQVAIFPVGAAIEAWTGVLEKGRATLPPSHILLRLSAQQRTRLFASFVRGVGVSCKGPQRSMLMGTTKREGEFWSLACSPNERDYVAINIRKRAAASTPSQMRTRDVRVWPCKRLVRDLDYKCFRVIK